jgi:formylglycine-generating enzyme required for sulfatase activity
VLTQHQVAFERRERAKTETAHQKAIASEQRAIAKELEAQRERQQAYANLDQAKQLGALKTVANLQQRFVRELHWTPLAYEGDEPRGDLDQSPTRARLAEAIATLDAWQTEVATLLDRYSTFSTARDAVPDPTLAATADERAWRELQHESYAQILDGMETLRSLQQQARERRRECQTRQQRHVEESHWNDTAARIRTNPRYSQGLRPGSHSALQPQVDLVPLGPDPASGLEEFAHLGSGAQVQRSRTGELQLDQDSGIVFVLIPAGRYGFGSTRASDPQANVDEAWHEADLDAFLLAKHELTQAQWVAMGGTNSSHWRAGQFVDGFHPTARHPVERVSWTECVELLARHGLVLPTERQWEAAARGGSTTPWWTGSQKSSLATAENVADALLERIGVAHESWSDGHAITAPVGSYALSHPFGLCDVAGNAREWCRDVYEPDGYSRLEALDRQGWRPAQRTDEARLRVIRGGSWIYVAVFARSASRGKNAPAIRDRTLGCRPSRSLTYP